LKKNVSFSIIGIGIALVFLLGMANLEQPNLGIESLVEPTETIITPKITTIDVETITTTPKQILIEPESEGPQISTQAILPITSAYAVTPNQATINIKTWNIKSSNFSPAPRFALDPNGNVFFIGSQKIALLDITSNILTKWTLPGEDPGPLAPASDLSGNGYFHDRANLKIGRVDPITDIFTLWEIPVIVNSQDMTSDSQGNIYVLDTQHIGKLVPSTNTFTIFTLTGFSDIRTMVVDSTGDIWFNDVRSRSIAKLDPSTNTITSWILPGEDAIPLDLALDSSGNVFFPSVPSPGKIGRLVPSSNTITTWSLPTEFSSARVIAVDSQGSVFFDLSNGPTFGRLVPSTNTITEWNNAAFTVVGVISKDLEVDSSDTIYYHDFHNVGIIT